MLLVVVAAAGASPLVLNEVLYDPPGADGGLEFVEIAAAAGGPPDASLAGWVLETGNGASPGSWKVAWTGGTEARLQDGLFVVGESGVEPPPDAVADLDLQNGPDACRLRGPGGVTDVLGWGAPLDPSLYEGAPAEDVSGTALARLPDGFDTDRNARDFLAAKPTPGAFNAADTAVVVERFGAPGAAAAGAPGTFEWVVRNVGRVPLAVRAEARCAVHPGEVLAAAVSAPLAPGLRDTLRARAGPSPGVHLPRSDPPGPEPEGAWPGAGADVRVTEVMARPVAGTPEWVELESAAAGPVDLAALGLEDASGTRASLHGLLSPSGFAVLTSDTAAVAAVWRLPPGVLLVEASPWPALNHTGPADRPAERITVGVGGVALETAAVPGGGAEGVSWERLSRYLPADHLEAWVPSGAPDGATPGSPAWGRGDRAVPAGPRGLSVHPSPFRPARDGAALVVVRSPGAPSCRIAVYDSWGQEVADLVPWTVGAGEHRALWDGRDGAGSPAPLGLYIVRADGPGLAAVHGTVVVDR